MKCHTCNGTGEVDFGKLPLHKKLRAARENMGLSVMSVKDKTGIVASQLSRYETGTLKKIPFDVVMKLCKLYQLRPEEL